MCFDMHQSEKLTVFVDDARRNGVTLLGPDMNASEAEFIVEQTDDGYAVRYGLAGIRNVGEKAMDAVVRERQESGRFESLEDLFQRMPHGAMSRRQLESLAGAGAFDSLEPNRAKVLANADMLLAVADAANREKSSGQAGLFGGEDYEEPALRLVEAEKWPRSEQMTQERETFGFFFAAHPVTEFRQIADANGARTYASLMGGGVAGGRQPAVMAVMVEGASKGRTKRGADFIRADFSDSSGQFSAACFEESLVENFQKWAKENTCILLNVELDAPSPDEPPRITVRGARVLADVSQAARMLLELDVTSEVGLQALKESLQPGRAGHGEVQAVLHLSDGQRVRMGLGNDFELGGELVDRLSALPGLAKVSLKPKLGPSRINRRAA